MQKLYDRADIYDLIESPKRFDVNKTAMMDDKDPETMPWYCILAQNSSSLSKPVQS